MKEKVEALFSDTNVKKYMAFNSAFLLNDYNNDNIGKLEDKYFIMFANGSGMKKAGINDGDTLFVKRIETPKNNTIITVMFEDGTMAVRRYLEIDGNKILRRENGRTPDLINPIFCPFGEVISVHRKIA
ncbi:MAG: hypothetical protein E7342_05785 [Clostridiales bacterium]|nr:hypothetical protein [Clostridiales bacterium]